MSLFGSFAIGFLCRFTICSRFLPICGIMKRIDQGFCAFSRFIQQLRILRILDVRRCASGINNHRSLVLRRVLILIVSLVRFFFRLLCRPNDHLIDFSQHLCCQPFAEMHHQGWVKRSAECISRQSTEKLQIRSLLNLKNGFFVRVTIFRLNNARPQCKP
ncbi:hypothetical protein SDC9_161207 [bioreactor metagenome]|uniref:Uncharacterized protein n=1 Tax=bioreactor metagenome TaxID=1076179 RepID=A0A645FHM1_9ZZZZ